MGLIADIKASVLAREICLLVAQVRGNNGALRANLLTDRLDERNTNLAVGSSNENLLSKLYKKR